MFGMTAYNRPSLFEQCSEALIDSIAGRHELKVVFDDHPTQIPQHKRLWDYAREKDCELHTFISNKHLGCAGAHRRLMEEAFKNPAVDAFVLVEDDGLVAPDFVDVMVELLERFKDDTDVFSVTGWFGHRSDIEQPDPTALIKRQWFTCHTFGFWRRCWDDVQAAGGVRGVHWKSGEQTPQEGQSMADLLKWDKDDGSWAIPFNHIYRGDRYEIATLLPRMKDIGTKGTFMTPHLHAEIMQTPFWSGGLDEYPDPAQFSIVEVTPFQ